MKRHLAESCMFMKRVLLFGNCYLTIFGFRKELIQRLVSEGFDVWVSFPNGAHGESITGEETSQVLGCKYIEIKMQRRNKKLVQELGVFLECRKIIRKIKPDCVLTFTVKPNLYMGYLAARYRIPFIMNITGLGSGFDRNALLTSFLVKAIRSNMEKAAMVFFQNQSDYLYFKNNNYSCKNCAILPGSGVNLDEYSVLPYSDGKIVFLYISRVMKEKGIEDFISLSKHFKNDDDVAFWVCGDLEEDYSDVIREGEKEGLFTYYGLVDNVKSYLEKAGVVVLPSFYHEGISNTLLEAAACGRPVITTDNPGCKPAVKDKISGFVFEMKNSEELISKAEQFIALPYEERKKMGLMGRKHVEDNFDRNIVVNKYMDVIDSFCIT